MKLMYAACDISKSQVDFSEKLVRVFLPSGGAIGRLVKRQKASSRCDIRIFSDFATLSTNFSNYSKVADPSYTKGAKRWMENQVESVYIPVKEMLSNAPGFRSLYSQRDIHFEEIYSDIIDRAFRPALRGPMAKARKRISRILQKNMEGKVSIKNEEFFIENKQENLEFTLLAEGIRKLGLLWLLIQNGTLLEGSVLFWDEPETNLNPKLYGPLMNILLELQRMGVQVFLATHDYVILKELDLKKQSEDNLLFHSLFKDQKSGAIQCHSTSEYLNIHPNVIQDTFLDLFDRDVKRDLE